MCYNVLQLKIEICDIGFCADSNLKNELSELHPPACGSGFVDIDLKVVVHQDTGTVIAFKPEHLHGMALSHGAGNSLLKITFSRRVSDAWAEALERSGQPYISQEEGEKDDD